MYKIYPYIKNAFSFYVFFVISVFAVPISFFIRRNQNPWVIGGHRGRLYDDNSAVLHEYITTQTSQDIIWITSNPILYKRFENQNIRVLKRNSIKSRMAILKAPVLIYSHGEDDLDLYLLFWRKILGTRIMLNHCLHHLKSSGCTLKQYISASSVRKYFYRKFVFINFDYLLASSEKERQKFSRTLPHYASKIVLGGGAHLDYFFNNNNHPTNNRILFFPTHRETEKGHQMLADIKRQIATHIDLIDYLKKEELTFVICTHINSSPMVNNEELESCFEIKVKFDDIKEEMARCALFISDYSSLSLDYLVFDKPLVYFPFDLEDFTIKRNFHNPTPFLEKQPGPVAFNLSELVEILITNKWKDQNTYVDAKAFWDKELFPFHSPVYAKNSYQKICELVSKRN